MSATSHDTHDLTPGAPAALGRGVRPGVVSVVTPSFNQGRFLAECLDSVARQSGVQIEHIVMDAGSTDDSVPILRARPNLDWRSGPDGGQVRAINAGLRRSRGEFVMWLNSDDALCEGALAALTEALGERPDALAAYGRARMIDEDGRPIRPYPTFELSIDDLRRKCYVCQPTVLIRRSALERVGLLNPALDLCFDYELWLRLLDAGEMVFVDREIALTRQHRATKTSSRRLRALVEAGYLMRIHFGRAPWRWSAKWVVHRWTLDRRRFLAPIVGWWSLLVSGARYHRHFNGARLSSELGGRRLRALASPPTLVAGDAPGVVIEPKDRARAASA